MTSDHVLLTLLYVGSRGCHNCAAFEQEWEKLVDLQAQGKLSPMSIELKEMKIDNHFDLPPGLREVVSFYPFIMIIPTRHLQENMNQVGGMLVGEVFYAYKVITNGVLEYRVCENVQDSPSMRYPRTAEGIQSWLEDVGIEAIGNLAPRYYPEILEFTSRRLRLRNLKTIDWRAERERFHKDMLLIPSLNKVYKLSSGGVVLHQRIRNNHD